MTKSVFDPKKLKRELAKFGMDLGVLPASSGKRKRKATPLSGKELARRLGGLLTRKEADELERHINESCEQVDD